MKRFEKLIIVLNSLLADENFWLIKQKVLQANSQLFNLYIC